MLWQKKKILGLDIGKRSIKAALLQRKGNVVFLESFIYFDLRDASQPSVEDDDVQRVLGALVDGNGLQNLQAASCIHDLEVRMFSFHLPPLPESEMRQVLVNEVESKTGESAASLAIDYLVSARDSRTVDGGQELHTYITRNESMQKQFDLVKSAELKPISLESSIQATLEGLRFNGYIAEDSAVVVIDIGESHITIALVLNGELVLMNCGKMGTGSINETLMLKFGCTYQESEEWKIAYQLVQSEVPNIDPASKIIEEGYYQIVAHIHDTISYYKASYKNRTISSVILTGGGAQKTSLNLLIAETVGLEVVMADAVKNLDIFAHADAETQERLPSISPFLHTAIGLALRGV